MNTNSNSNNQSDKSVPSDSDPSLQSNLLYLRALKGLLLVNDKLTREFDPSPMNGSDPSQISPSLPLNSSDWLDRFNASICSSATLGELTVPARQPILGKWFHQGDLGFIYGPRGLGKTWLALHIARQCADGGPVGPWTAHAPCPVLYIDGEMPLDDIRQRDTILNTVAIRGPATAPGGRSSTPSQALSPSLSSLTSVNNSGNPRQSEPSAPSSPTPNDSADPQSNNLFYLHHEALFHNGGKVFNLSLPEVQDAILELCQQRGIQILFLDNLSCLFAGLTENGADAWEQVLPWLLNLRRNRIAVVFVAHAGRSGTMRGTSRREDAAFWVIQLSQARASGGHARQGAKFIATFVKNRNATDAECPPLEWHFHEPSPGEAARITWKAPSTRDLFRQAIHSGLSAAGEIAHELGVSRGMISRLAVEGEREGWLVKRGRQYQLASLAESSLTE